MFSFGLFESYYASTLMSGGQSASVGTTASGILYLSSPLVVALLAFWPEVRRISMLVGLLIMVAGLVGASFATTEAGLIGTQGVMYAIGAGFCYTPVFRECLTSPDAKQRLTSTSVSR